MTTSQQERVRRRVAALAATPTGTDAFSHAVCALVGEAAPFDYACLATTDPATGMITGAVKSHAGDSADAEWARYEYEVDDLNLYPAVARRPVPVGVLGIDTGGRPERSTRFIEFLLPRFGFGHEMRVAFRSPATGTPGTAWGVLGLYRSTGSRPFTPDEAAFAGSLSSTVAGGLRRSLLVDAARTLTARGPAVVILDADDRIRQVTAAGQERIDEFGGIQFGSLPMPLASVVAAARAARHDDTVLPRARVRTAAGGWLVVHAAPLVEPDTGTREVVLTIEPAGPGDIIPLVVAAFGLTNREQDVVQLVLLGAGTAAIAASLHLSPYTVQDHLKSVFAKAGVGSRRELAARVFFDHYAPQLVSPRAPSGWFTAQ